MSDLADTIYDSQRIIDPLTHLLKSLRIGQAFAADLDAVDAARRDAYGGVLSHVTPHRSWECHPMALEVIVRTIEFPDIPIIKYYCGRS